MAGFLDEYGAGDEKRSRLIKRLLLGGVLVIAVAATLYFTLRFRGEEQLVNQFLDRLKAKDYQGAYQLWAPSRYYSPEMFVEDWGPSSHFADAASVKILHEDACGNGVVFNVEASSGANRGLFVEDGTQVVSFAQEARCPGKHFYLWEFVKSHLGGQS